MTNIISFEEYKPPAFQFYANDWLSSLTVGTTSNEFQGGFVKLLCYQWDEATCSLPDDDEQLAQMSGFNDNFPKFEAKLKQLFIKVPELPNRRVNLRLLNLKREMYETYVSKCKAGKKGGKSSGKSRTSKSKQNRSKNEANANPSSSSSTSTSLTGITNVIPDTTRPKWPPPGNEVATHVFLTDQQIDSLKRSFTSNELNYWIQELSDSAVQNFAKWKKTYSDHSAVIRKWRTRKLESGLIWDDLKKLYQYPPKTFTPKGSSLEKHKDLVSTLREREQNEGK